MNIEALPFSWHLQVKRRADERTRTADLLITSELLYLLSYVGLLRRVSISQGVGGVILLWDQVPHLHRARFDKLYLEPSGSSMKTIFVILPIGGYRLGPERHCYATLLEARRCALKCVLPGPHHGGQACNNCGRHRRQRLRRKDAGGDHTRADMDRERLIERSSKTRATLAPRSLVAYHQRHEGAAGDSHDRQLKGVRR
jgi:hypothetical protein